MVKNIVFDIGNVILNFDYKKFLDKYTTNKQEQEMLEKYVINSPEWTEYALIDTGYIKREDAIKIVQDRTNHLYDELIERFWNTYNDYAYIDNNVLDLIKKLKNNGYNIYLLSNSNPYTYNYIKNSELFNIVDGYVLSFIEHQVKPYESIYKTLINKYNITPEESIFIDDNIRNVEGANKLGFIGLKVDPDNYNSIVESLRKVNIR
ncbi:MAG: HAD-IA family hydrolase [Bacilli bacterium]|nr:HAD-IA family hydrolase [Bacilli bacterium]